MCSGQYKLVSRWCFQCLQTTTKWNNLYIIRYVICALDKKKKKKKNWLQLQFTGAMVFSEGSNNKTWDNIKLPGGGGSHFSYYTNTIHIETQQHNSRQVEHDGYPPRRPWFHQQSWQTKRILASACKHWHQFSWNASSVWALQVIGHIKEDYTNLNTKTASYWFSFK